MVFDKKEQKMLHTILRSAVARMVALAGLLHAKPNYANTPIRSFSDVMVAAFYTMRAMLFLPVCLAVPAYGQSTLPACDPNVAATSWTNCQGTFTWASGTKYVGEFRDGKGNGQGTLTTAKSDKYVGEFRDGKYHGQGTYYFLAENQFKGDKYVGEWRDHKRHGQGIYTLADGRPPLEGLWEDNKFVRAQRIPDHIIAAGRLAEQAEMKSVLAPQTLEERMRTHQEQQQKKQRRDAELYQKQKQVRDKEEAERVARNTKEIEEKRKLALSRTTVVYACGDMKPHPWTLRFTKEAVNNITGQDEYYWDDGDAYMYYFDKSKGIVSWKRKRQ